MNRMLLHACCGVCALEPVRILKEEGIEFSLDYTNPNIAPKAEYDRRLDALRDYVAKPEGIELFTGAYNTQAWEEKVAVFGDDKPARCRACYRLRFEAVAARAQSHGFTSICSTLTISPYQYRDIIFEELERAAHAHNLQAQLRDWSGRYRDATRRSRENGMYRQKFCGCRFSAAEAHEQEREREAARARARRIKQAALLQAAAEGSVNQANLL